MGSMAEPPAPADWHGAAGTAAAAQLIRPVPVRPSVPSSPDLNKPPAPSSSGSLRAGGPASAWSSSTSLLGASSSAASRILGAPIPGAHEAETLEAVLTTHAVHADLTVVMAGEEAKLENPDDWAVWSLLACLLCNICAGYAAWHYSAKTSDANLARSECLRRNDFEAARTAYEHARKWSQLTLGCIGVAVLAGIGFWYLMVERHRVVLWEK